MSNKKNDAHVPCETPEHKCTPETWKELDAFCVNELKDAKKWDYNKEIYRIAEAQGVGTNEVAATLNALMNSREIPHATS